MENTRAAAKAAGETRFVGKPCKHGHSGLRWTANRLCVECLQMRRGGTPTRAYKARSPSGTREAAKAAGQKFYIGEPCEHGHSGERYTSNALCVECGRAKAIAQVEAGEVEHNRARRRNAFIAEMYPEEFDRRGWRRGKTKDWGNDNDDLVWGLAEK